MTKPYIVHDKFFKKAKEKGYRARSAFKLEEILRKYRLIKPGQVVVRWKKTILVAPATPESLEERELT